MNPNQQTTLNQAVKLLQSLLKGGVQSSGPSNVIIPQYDAQIQSFYQKGHALEPEIQQLTDIYKKASTAMKAIISYSQVCKKFSATQQQKLKNIFISLSNDIEAIIKKNPNFIDHCKAIKEILSATFWVFVSTPEFIVKGGIQGADFNALKFQKKKVKQHNEWWALITAAGKSLEKYVVKNYPMGLNFKFNGQDKWDQIISGTSSSAKSSQQTAPQQSKQQQPQQKAPVAKAPKKDLIGLNWQIRNYTGENITLGNQIQMKHNIFLQNCSNCQIKIDSKFKSLNLNKCQKVTVFIKSCVSGVELINCKSLNLVIKQKTPSVSVDKSEKVNLILNQSNIDTDIVSCKASQFNVTVQTLNGDEGKPYMISDQLITKWNAKTKKFQTTVYDKFL